VLLLYITNETLLYHQYLTLNAQACKRLDSSITASAFIYRELCCTVYKLLQCVSPSCLLEHLKLAVVLTIFPCGFIRAAVLCIMGRHPCQLASVAIRRSTVVLL
jgi:hypothetical protein